MASKGAKRARKPKNAKTRPTLTPTDEAIRRLARAFGSPGAPLIVIDPPAFRKADK